MSPNASLCPDLVQQAFLAYINDGVPPGDFVRACLENNLVEAFKRADDTNREALPHIVAWLYNEMPASAWGSEWAVYHHLCDAAEEPERDEPVIYNRGELPPRDSRDEHDRTL